VILIVSDPLDGHVRLVTQRLQEKGGAVARIDLGEFPAESTLSCSVENGRPAGFRARRPRGDLDLTAVKTVWFRRLSDVRPDERLEGQDREFVAKETNAHLMSLGIALRERFCVNPIDRALATDRGNGKVSQLEIARSLGLSVPRTLATNDPEHAREFVLSCKGGAIYKPFLAPTRSRSLGPDTKKKAWSTVFTTKIDEAALAKLDGVRLAPCIFQEYVPKAVELRVTVIGSKVFATEIHSQVSEKSAVDFRAHYDLGNTPYFAHELPRPIEEKILAVNRELGLVFGAHDLIKTPDGEYVFLEVNQQGQFLWLEEQTGQPLLDNFCELLLQARPDFRCDAPRHEPGLPQAPELEARDKHLEAIDEDY
jgi:glutathione synthase/RimK-type ligase-like ATP-grasp enzyme